MAAPRGPGRVLCFMAHGMGGTSKDWDTWVEVLSARFPAWGLKPLETLSEGARLLGRAVDVLAVEAADEIVGALTVELSKHEHVTVHCIGHSMGGLILRGALPRVFDGVDAERVRLGHYLSLSSPYLGVQASWSALSHARKNLIYLTWPVSSQLTQLAIQDTGGASGLPYLVTLSDPAGPYLAQLRRFRSRTCATLAKGDALIPLASGLIEPDHRHYQWYAFAGEESFWHLEDVSGSRGGDGSQETGSAGATGPTPGPPAESAAWESPGLVRKRGRSDGCDEQPLSERLRGWLAALVRAFPLVPHAFLRLLWASESNARLPPPAERRAPSAASVGASLQWRCSASGECRFPARILGDLNTLQWRRAVVEMHHRRVPRNAHVFLIGKRSEQFEQEHLMSRECIESLSEFLT